MGSRSESHILLSRNALHRDHGVCREVPRNVRRMGSQRKSRHGSRRRRRSRRRQIDVLYETRRSQRRRRPAVYRRVYRRQRRNGSGGCRRSGDAFFAKRTGFAFLCKERARPDAGACRFRRSQGIFKARFRPFRRIRHPRNVASYHTFGTRPKLCRIGRKEGTGTQTLHKGRQKVGNDACSRQGQTSESGRKRIKTRRRGAARILFRRDAFEENGHSDSGCRLSICERGHRRFDI